MSSGVSTVIGFVVLILGTAHTRLAIIDLLPALQASKDGDADSLRDVEAPSGAKTVACRWR